MIASLEGIITARSIEYAVIEVGGIGFKVFASARTLDKLPAAGEKVRMLCSMQTSDAGVFLYGFLSEREQTLFEKLLTVPSIGPKGALAALGSFEPADLVRAIVNEDIAALTSIPGVGKKTASRIVVELQNALEQTILDWPEVKESASASTAAPSGQAAQTALEALRSMGFTEAEATLALKDAPGNLDDVGLISYALKQLGSN